MSRKIIDGYRLYYLNDLFDINLILLRPKSYVPTSSLCMGATLFDHNYIYTIIKSSIKKAKKNHIINHININHIMT